MAHQLDRGCDVGRRHGDAVAQLVRAGQVDVAPGPRLGLVAELVVGVREQRVRVPVLRIGEHDVVHERGDPAVLAAVVRFARATQHFGGAAHRVDVAGRLLHGRQRVEVGGIRVVPAEVVLVHRLRVVTDRSVVAAHREVARERSGELELFRDLARRRAAVREPQRLVVQVLVRVAVLREVRERAFVAEHRPVVTRERDLGVAEARDRVVEVAAPEQGVAHLRAAQRVQVVERVGRQLGGAVRLLWRAGRRSAPRAPPSSARTGTRSRTPSIVIACGVRSTRSVGSTKPSVPTAGALPSPVSTWPRGLRASGMPYMYAALRPIATPASTFSRVASSVKPCGATMRNAARAAGSSGRIAATPPK